MRRALSQCVPSVSLCILCTPRSQFSFSWMLTVSKPPVCHRATPCRVQRCTSKLRSTVSASKVRSAFRSYAFWPCNWQRQHTARISTALEHAVLSRTGITRQALLRVMPGVVGAQSRKSDLARLRHSPKLKCSRLYGDCTWTHTQAL